ncbi:hypothetical protein ABZ672_45930, partial [Streptomyces mirabilis]
MGLLRRLQAGGSCRLGFGGYCGRGGRRDHHPVSDATVTTAFGSVARAEHHRLSVEDVAPASAGDT